MVNKPRMQKFKKETSFKLLKIANDDLYAAQILATASRIRSEIIIFHVSQAVEKSLKAVIIYLEKTVPLTHDLALLMNELPDDYIKDLPEGLDELTIYSTIKRYIDGDELIEQSDVLAALKVGQIVVDWAKKHCRTEI